MPRVKEVLKRVKKLEIKTSRLVEGLVSGEYHSVFKGRGIEFAEVRGYVPGDDIRAIDWNVTARFNAPFVKEFIEERDLTLFIVFDVSSSNEFGFERRKKEIGYDIAASLMFAALRNNDRVGLCLFTSEVELFIPPGKGKKHMLKLLRELIYYEPKNRNTDIRAALSYLNNVIKKRSIVFIISDFLAPDFERPLKQLKNRHDVILVNITDMREAQIPDIGYAFLEDQETGEQMLVDTSDPEFRARYTELVKAKQDAFFASMKRIGVDIIQVNTSEPFYIPLQRFFKMRARRVTR
ncbi:MAG: DUF58 domain-containing protein [Candidatus Methanophagaceae archaeon]|nr:MAG: DUF58 domain-containing protein [Methanophagales archaeon]